MAREDGGNLRTGWVAHRHATYVIESKNNYPMYETIADLSTSALTSAITSENCEGDK